MELAKWVNGAGVKGAKVLHIRRIDLAVLRALPGIAAACALVFYLAQVVIFYVDAPVMATATLVVFASWSVSVVNPRYILTREPMDERVRGLLYGIALLAVWCAAPAVNAVLQQVFGVPEIAALTVGWMAACAVGVAGHFVVDAGLRRHVAGLPLLPRRRQRLKPLPLDISLALARARTHVR